MQYAKGVTDPETDDYPGRFCLLGSFFIGLNTLDEQYE